MALISAEASEFYMRALHREKVHNKYQSKIYKLDLKI